MLRIIPKWSIRIERESANGNQIENYLINADNFLEVIQWLSKLNFELSTIKSVIIQLEKNI
jgi:hypothetical protein